MDLDSKLAQLLSNVSTITDNLPDGVYHNAVGLNVGMGENHHLNLLTGDHDYESKR
jgi:hypothetical protein